MNENISEIRGRLVLAQLTIEVYQNVAVEAIGLLEAPDALSVNNKSVIDLLKKIGKRDVRDYYQG